MTQLHEPLDQQAPEAQRPTPIEAAPPRARWSARIEGGIGSCLAAAWVVGYFTAGMLEPTPRDPSVMNAWYVTVINAALLGSLGVMVLGLIARRRFGVFASVVATAAFATAVVACPITGHHSFGAWWFAQLLCVAGVAAATGYALLATRA